MERAFQYIELNHSQIEQVYGSKIQLDAFTAMCEPRIRSV